MSAEFKYTITVEKAEQTDDGLFIEGVASGLGVDSQGHEMDAKAIAGFAEQIRMRAEAGDPIPYLDWHNDKSVMSELGSVVDGSVDPDWNLRIRVKLDEDNAASTLLYKRIKRGKKFGMSVKGTADKWAERFDDAGRRVLRFFDVALTEVSNTTKPIWTPSFGTVLAKAVIDEADAESVQTEGDTPEMSKDDTADLTTGEAEGAPANDETTEPEAAAADGGAEDTTAAAESEASENEVEVMKAGAKYSKKARETFLSMYKQMGDMLRAEGILDDEDEPVELAKADGDEAAPADAKTPDDASDSAETTDTPAADAASDSDDASKGADAEPAKTPRELELEAALAEMTTRAEAAEAAQKAPQLVVSPESTQPAEDERTRVVEAIKALPREQRLAAAFQLAETAKVRR